MDTLTWGSPVGLGIFLAGLGVLLIGLASGSKGPKPPAPPNSAPSD